MLLIVTNIPCKPVNFILFHNIHMRKCPVFYRLLVKYSSVFRKGTEVISWGKLGNYVTPFQSLISSLLRYSTVSRWKIHSIILSWPMTLLGIQAVRLKNSKNFNAQSVTNCRTGVIDIVKKEDVFQKKFHFVITFLKNCFMPKLQFEWRFTNLQFFLRVFILLIIIN